MNFRKKINSKYGFAFTLPFFLAPIKSKLVRNKEDDLDYMNSQLNQYGEGVDLSDILSNPNFQGDPEHLMEESIFNSISPPQFSYLHSQFKTSLDQENWKGLKLGLSWHPTMTLNSELTLNIEKARGFLKNYTLSTTTILPSKYNLYLSKVKTIRIKVLFS